MIISSPKQDPDCIISKRQQSIIPSLKNESTVLSLKKKQLNILQTETPTNSHYRAH